MEQTHIEKEIAKFSVTDAAIAGLNNQYSHLTINGIEDKQGYLAVREARLVVKNKRVEVEKKRKELTADALAVQRAINEEAKRITGLLEPLEDYLKTQEDNYNKEKERLKKEQEHVEQALIASRAKMLLEIGFIFDGLKFSANYHYKGTENSPDYMSYTEELYPHNLKDYSEDRFNEVYAHCYLRHQEKQNYLAEEKRKQEELEAKIEAERKAEAERLEAERQKQLAKEAEERRVEQEKLAIQRAEQETERKRLEAIAREQAEKEAALKAEQERLSKIKEEAERPTLVISQEQVTVEEQEPDFDEVSENIVVHRIISIDRDYILNYINNYFSITEDQIQESLKTIDHRLDDVIGQLIKESINEHRDY
ncbi:MAG TPA: hypothetical protein VGW78_07585 [Candidatus Babeliales bacterium]|jgi:hypothetical protein|nr:hypothetical protein [Candidatus Babeliales bacterium]